MNAQSKKLHRKKGLAMRSLNINIFRDPCNLFIAILRKLL